MTIFRGNTTKNSNAHKMTNPCINFSWLGPKTLTYKVGEDIFGMESK